jgi:hypothetical protein
MKKLLLLLIAAMLSISIFSQSSFKWLKLDSIKPYHNPWIQLTAPLRFLDGTIQTTAGGSSSFPYTKTLTQQTNWSGQGTLVLDSSYSYYGTLYNTRFSYVTCYNYKNYFPRILLTVSGKNPTNQMNLDFDTTGIKFLNNPKYINWTSNHLINKYYFDSLAATLLYVNNKVLWKDSINMKMGLNSLASKTTGIKNIGIGARTLTSTTTGNYNLGIGSDSTLLLNTTGNNNIGLGYLALTNNTTGGANIGIGNGANYGCTTGSDNLGIGYNVLKATYTGNYNTAICDGALANLTTGSNNYGLGGFALNAFKTGNSNIAFGTGALIALKTGQYNVVIGDYAYKGDTIGSNNVIIGRRAGYSNISGSNNLFLGYNAGYYELKSSRLFINNNNGDSAHCLIWGAFDLAKLRFQAKVGINQFPDATAQLAVTGKIISTDSIRAQKGIRASGYYNLDGTLASPNLTDRIFYYNVANRNYEPFPSYQSNAWYYGSTIPTGSTNITWDGYLTANYLFSENGYSQPNLNLNGSGVTIDAVSNNATTLRLSQGNGSNGHLIQGCIGSSTDIYFDFNPLATSGSIAYTFDTYNILASGKLFSFKNGNTEKANIMYDGTFNTKKIISTDTIRAPYTPIIITGEDTTNSIPSKKGNLFVDNFGRIYTSINNQRGGWMLVYPINNITDYLKVYQKTGISGKSVVFQVLDSSAYNRFLITDKGMLVAGRQHKPIVNIDGLAMIGANNSLNGKNSTSIGYHVYNKGDTSLVIGAFIDSTTQANKVTIGSGINTTQLLANTTPNSVAIGANETTPTLVLTSGNVSIKGDVDITGQYKVNGSPLSEGTVYCSTTNITSSQILNGDEVELVPAPGVGKSIYPVNMMVIPNTGTAAYTGGGDNLIKIGTLQNKTYADLNLGLTSTTGYIQYLVPPFQNTAIDNYDVTNKAISLALHTHTTGDFDIKVKLYYYIVTH